MSDAPDPARRQALAMATLSCGMHMQQHPNTPLRHPWHDQPRIYDPLGCVFETWQAAEHPKPTIP